MHRTDLLECPCSPPLIHPLVMTAQQQHRHSTGGQISASDYSPSTSSSLYASAPSSYLGQQNDAMVAAAAAGLNDFCDDVVVGKEKSPPKKATMIGQEYEVLLQSALEEQAQHYEGEITRLRATLTEQQVEKKSMTPGEVREVERLRTDISRQRSKLDRASRELLDFQSQEAGYRATSQRLLREQQVAQEKLKKIRRSAAEERDEGRQKIEELEQQIADLTANQRMRDQFSQDQELYNAQIFGTQQQTEKKSHKKGRKGRRLFRK